MSLTTVQEIERAIATLTPQQLADLYAWLDEYDPQPIDARLQPTSRLAVWTTPSPARWMMKRTVA